MTIKKLIKEVFKNDIKALKKKYKNIKTIQFKKSKYSNVSKFNILFRLQEIIYLQKLEPTKYVLIYNYEYKERQLYTNKCIYKYILKEVVFEVANGENKIIEIQLYNNHTVNKVIKINA